MYALGSVEASVHHAVEDVMHGLLLKYGFTERFIGSSCFISPQRRAYLTDGSSF